MRCAALFLALLLGSAAPAKAEVLLAPAFHASFAKWGEGLAGALSVDALVAWVPIPELGFGLELGAGLPVGQGQVQNASEVALLTHPFAMLRFGGDRSWSFVRLGLGVSHHLLEGGYEPVMVATGAAGYIAAPPTLPFFFGFEIRAEVSLAGAMPAHTAGIGALLGWLL